MALFVKVIVGSKEPVTFSAISWGQYSRKNSPSLTDGTSTDVPSCREQAWGPNSLTLLCSEFLLVAIIAKSGLKMRGQESPLR